MSTKWSRCCLGDLVEFRNGVNFTRASEGSTIKVVGVGDFQRKEVLDDFSSTSLVTINGGVSTDDLLVDNDLLFVRSNGNKALVGRCVLVRGVAEPITFSGFTIRARITVDAVEPLFLSKLVRSSLFWQHLHWYGSGSSINNLSQEVLRDFSFALPSIVEQRKIAKMIGIWDEAIDSASRLRNAKTKQYREARKRLSVTSINGEQISRTPRLAEIANRVRLPNDGRPLPVMTISAKSGFLLQSDKYSREMAGKSLENYIMLRRGDFAYNKGNSLTAPQGCIFRLSDEKALVPHVYFCFSLREDLHADYFAHLFESGYLNHQLSRVINSGVRNDGLLNLASKDFFNCRVPLPSHKEQVLASELLNGLKRELELLERQVTSLEKQRRGLMQKLLAGEWRLPC